jgi:hypothetical protein
MHSWTLNTKYYVGTVEEKGVKFFAQIFKTFITQPLLSIGPEVF